MASGAGTSKLPNAAVARNPDSSTLDTSPTTISPTRRSSRAWLPPQGWWRLEWNCAFREPSVLWFFPSNLMLWFIFVGPMAFVQKIVLAQFPGHGTILWTVVISLRGVTTQLASPLLGAISDRIGRKPVLLFFILTSSLCVLALGVSSDPVVASRMACIGIVMGGLGGSPFAIPFAYCADLVSRQNSHKLATMNARMVLSMNIAFILGPALCSFLFKVCKNDQRAWQLLFGISLLNMLYTALLVPESLGYHEDSASPNRRASAEMRAAGQTELPSQNLRLNPFVYFRLLQPSGPAGRQAAALLRQLSEIIFWLYLAKMNVVSCTVIYAIQVLKWTPAQAGSLMSIWGVVQFLSMGTLSLAGHSQNRFLHDERLVNWIGIVGGFVGMVLFFFTVQGWTLALGMAVSAVSMVSLTAITGYAGRLVDRSMQGEVQGLLSSILAITEVLGPPIFGSMLQWAESRPSEEWWILNLPFLMGALSVLAAMFCSYGLPHSSKAAEACREDRCRLIAETF